MKAYKQRAAQSRRDFAFWRSESGFVRKLRKALGGELPEALLTDPDAHALEGVQRNLNDGRPVYFDMGDSVKMCRRVRGKGKIRCHRVTE